MVDELGSAPVLKKRFEDREPHRRARINMEIQKVMAAFVTRKSPA